MANKKPKQNKPKTGLARCLELASNKKGLVFLALYFKIFSYSSRVWIYALLIFTNF